MTLRTGEFLDFFRALLPSFLNVVCYASKIYLTISWKVRLSQTFLLVFLDEAQDARQRTRR